MGVWKQEWSTESKVMVNKVESYAKARPEMVIPTSFSSFFSPPLSCWFFGESPWHQLKLPRHFTSPLSLWRDLFITLDLNDFFSSTNAELCLSPMKIDHFPQSGFQGLNLFAVFHQYFYSSQYKVLLTMWAVWWWCRLWVLWVYKEKTHLLPLILMKLSAF